MEWIHAQRQFDSCLACTEVCIIGKNSSMMCIIMHVILPFTFLLKITTLESFIKSAHMYILKILYVFFFVAETTKHNNFCSFSSLRYGMLVWGWWLRSLPEIPFSLWEWMCWNGSGTNCSGFLGKTQSTHSHSCCSFDEQPNFRCFENLHQWNIFV